MRCSDRALAAYTVILFFFLVFYLPSWWAEWDHQHELCEAANVFHSSNCADHALQVRMGVVGECHARQHLIRRNPAWHAIGVVLARWFGSTFGEGLIGIIVFVVMILVLVVVYRAMTAVEGDLRGRKRNLMPMQQHSDYGEENSNDRRKDF